MKAGLLAGVPGESAGAVLVGERVALEGRTDAGQGPGHRDREHDDAPQQHQRNSHLRGRLRLTSRTLY